MKTKDTLWLCDFTKTENMLQLLKNSTFDDYFSFENGHLVKKVPKQIKNGK